MRERLRIVNLFVYLSDKNIPEIPAESQEPPAFNVENWWRSWQYMHEPGTINRVEHRTLAGRCGSETGRLPPVRFRFMGGVLFEQRHGNPRSLGNALVV